MTLKKYNFLILAILYLAFISLGLPDQSLGVAWPSMRASFGMPLDAAGILIMIAALLSAGSSFLSGFFINRVKISTILSVSCCLTASGILMLGLAQSWWVVLLAYFLLGIGAGAIDTSLNDYVAKNYASKQMNWLHGCWGIGATLGPAIITFALGAYHNWRVGYLIIAGIQFALMLLFISSAKLWNNKHKKEARKENADKGIKLCSPAPIIGMLLFVLYTGVEASIGLWFYSVMIEKYGITKALGGSLITLYWACLTFGRFLIGFISEKLGNRKIIICGISLALLGVLCLFSASTILITLGLALCGFGLSGIYPSMMHETPNRFGDKLGAIMTGFQGGAGSMGVVIICPTIGVILNSFGLFWLLPILAALLLVSLSLNVIYNKIC